KLEKPRLVSMTTSQSLSPPSINRAITQQDASKVCLTASVHDVTSIDARTSRIEKCHSSAITGLALWHAEFSAQDIADAGRIRARTNRPAPFPARYAANSSSNAFASFRSRVSNPSVNHP